MLLRIVIAVIAAAGGYFGYKKIAPATPPSPAPQNITHGTASPINYGTINGGISAKTTK